MSAYQYDLKFRKGSENIPADLLSRLPLPGSSSHVVHYCDLLPSPVPINFIEIARETVKDPLLVKVKALTLSGWPEENSDANLVPFWSRRHELSLEKDCVLWGNRVIIPKKLQSDVLKLLHVNHPGISRMKALARSVIWFPTLDHQIEQMVKSCEVCAVTQNSCPQYTIPWQKTERFFQRVHIDYAKFESSNIFILIDGFSKWVEAIVVKDTEADTTIDTLNGIFATFGFPEEIVSDNGPQFTSEKFAVFCHENNVKHTLTPPYHSQSNGSAERAV
jgi:hypothetical protein